MGEPDRDSDDANVKQLLQRREEEAHPSARCCVIKKKIILLFKAHFSRQTLARSRPNKTLFRGQYNIDTSCPGNKTSYRETLKITTD